MSKVYFVSSRETKRSQNYFYKIEKLLEKVNFSSIYKKYDIVGVKLHFGEKGSSAFIKPNYVSFIVKKLKELNAKPFLTDTATLYVGSRRDAVSHIETAIFHGFSYATTQAPIIIADGLFGTESVSIEVNCKNFKLVEIARTITEAPKLLVLSHFKGHELTGFGGAIKNLGMGCAARKGKLAMHSNFRPQIDRKKCKGCFECLKECPANAIKKKNNKAMVDMEKCIGCGTCLAVCKYNAIKFDWNVTTKEIMEKICEYALGVIKTKKEIVYLNFLIQITPLCDCWSHSDSPIVSDVGIAASTDPVALDAACCELVNKAYVNKNSILKEKSIGSDIFASLYPEVDYKYQFEYAEKIGLGSKNFELEEVEV